MRVIFARCRCIYSGRIDAELEIGDRLIIRKDDGAVIVHATAGLKERNWMPAGSSWSEEPGLVVCEFPKRQERLDIYLDEVYSDREHTAYLDGKLLKLGSERAFSDLIRDHVDLVLPGVKVLRREAPTPVGPIDLLAQDAQGLVAVEVKRVRGVGAEVAYQIQRYLDALARMPEWSESPARGVLVAPGLAKGVKELLKERGVEYVRLSYEELEERAATEASRDPRPLAAIAVERQQLLKDAAARRGLENVRLLDPALRGSGAEREIDLLVDVPGDEQCLEVATMVNLAGLAAEVAELLGRPGVDVSCPALLDDADRERLLAAAVPL